MRIFIIMTIITNVPPGAEPKASPPAASKFIERVANRQEVRPRLLVPEFYRQSEKTRGPDGIINNMRGILFPYTPTITQDYSARYASQQVTHSNYSMHFFRSSEPGEINLTATFTVQSDRDAQYYLSVIHLLRALTKMRFGTDANAGAPPPVCRLDAYGEEMFSNVPVVVKTFNIKLPNDVHYYQQGYGSMVPVRSEISISMIPVYSRNEMKNFSVNGWLNGNLRSRGYL
jgi:hypothetical protein